MGQYYRAVLGDKEGNNKKVFDLEDPKLTELAWIGPGYIDTVEHHLISKPQRIMLVGDYAYELSKIKNKQRVPTYEEVWPKNRAAASLIKLDILPPLDWEKYYLVNHERKEFIGMHKYLYMGTYKQGNCLVCMDPLPLLTAVGNGKGGGDYRGDYKEYVGSWAWNLISIEPKINNKFTIQEDYKEILPLFKDEI